MTVQKLHELLGKLLPVHADCDVQVVAQGPQGYLTDLDTFEYTVVGVASDVAPVEGPGFPFVQLVVDVED